MSDLQRQGDSRPRLVLAQATREREDADLALAQLRSQLDANASKVASLAAEIALTQQQLDQYAYNLPVVERQKLRADKRLRQLQLQASEAEEMLKAERRMQEYLEELQRDDDERDLKLKEYLGEVLGVNSDGESDSEGSECWSVLSHSKPRVSSTTGSALVGTVCSHDNSTHLSGLPLTEGQASICSDTSPGFKTPCPYPGDPGIASNPRPPPISPQHEALPLINAIDSEQHASSAQVHAPSHRTHSEEGEIIPRSSVEEQTAIATENHDETTLCQRPQLEAGPSTPDSMPTPLAEPSQDAHIAVTVAPSHSQSIHSFSRSETYSEPDEALGGAEVSLVGQDVKSPLPLPFSFTEQKPIEEQGHLAIRIVETRLAVEEIFEDAENCSETSEDPGQETDEDAEDDRRWHERTCTSPSLAEETESRNIKASFAEAHAVLATSSGAESTTVSSFPDWLIHSKEIAIPIMRVTTRAENGCVPGPSLDRTALWVTRFPHTDHLNVQLPIDRSEEQPTHSECDSVQRPQIPPSNLHRYPPAARCGSLQASTPSERVVRALGSTLRTCFQNARST